MAARRSPVGTPLISAVYHGIRDEGRFGIFPVFLSVGWRGSFELASLPAQRRGRLEWLIE